MRASLARWGDCLAIRLPKELAASVGMREGAAVELTVEDGALVLRRRAYDIGERVAAVAGAEPPPVLSALAPVSFAAANPSDHLGPSSPASPRRRHRRWCRNT